MGLLLVYGLNTWLPKIMGEAGYSIKAGTGLLLVLNVGAVIGLLIAGQLSDARGNKPTVLLWFGLAAVFLALLSIKLHSTTLVYAAVLLTGVFVFSSQVLVYAFVGHLYPPEVRGTALGMSAGVGRVGAIVGPSLGGALVTAGIAYPWGFYAFAVAAVLAVLALATVPAQVDRHRACLPRPGHRRSRLPPSGRRWKTGPVAGNVSSPGATVTSRALALVGAFDEEHRRLTLTELAHACGTAGPDRAPAGG